MTIGKETWEHIKATKSKYILPRPDGSTNVDVLEKKNVQLVTFDHLGALRTTQVSFEVNEKTGSYGRIICRKYIEKVFELPFSVLHHTEVQRVVVCLDAYDRRRPEKTATTAQRKRSRPQDSPAVVVPTGQMTFFEDTESMPCDLDFIFDDAQLKAEFYCYITDVFKNLSNVPEGKTLILSRGLEWSRDEATGHRTPIVIPPLEVTSAGARYMHEVVNDNVSEGDLDAWYWPVNVFPKDNVHVHSFDGDVFLVGLLQMRRIYEATPDRICMFVTRRSVGNELPEAKEIQFKEAAKQRRAQVFSETLVSTANYEQAFHAAGGYPVEPKHISVDYTEELQSFSSAKRGRDSGEEEEKDSSLKRQRATSGAPRKKTIWQEYHIDVKDIYLDILNNDHTANPVEVYVVMLMLSSAKHDYIQTNLLTPGVGKDFVWRTFMQDEQHFKDLIKVYSCAGSIELYYEIDLLVFSKFVEAIYHCKGRVPKTDGRTLAKIAAQTVWTLQYLSNGVIANYDIIDGLSMTITGESIYGFNTKGWAATVYNNEQRKISCPPILR